VDHESHQRARYKAGTLDAVTRSSYGISVPGSQARPAGQSGHSTASARQDYFHSWVFLAWAHEVSEVEAADNEHSFLE